jgi:hypothetical protein
VDRVVDSVFVWAAVVVFGSGLALTIGWPPEAALFPRTIGVAGLAVALFSAVRPLVRGAGSAGDQHTDRTGGDGARQAESPAAGRAGEVRVFTWAAGFFLAVWLLGFQIGLPIAMGLYYIVEARLRPLFIAGAVLAAAFAIWLIGTYLHVPLYPGFIPD